MKKLFVTIGSLLILGFGAGGAVGATIPSATASAACGGSFLGLPTWYRGLTDGNCDIKGPGQADGALSKYIWTIVLNIVEIAVFIVGYIAIFYIIFGGFRFMTTGGSPEGRAGAMKTVLNAVIGLVIAICSVAILRLLGQVVVGTTNSTTGIVVADSGQVLTAVLNTVFFLGGMIAVLMIIIGGFNFVTSAGNPQKAAKARGVILYSVVGMVVMMAAAGIVNFVQGRF